VRRAWGVLDYLVCEAGLMVMGDWGLLWMYEIDAKQVQQGGSVPALLLRIKLKVFQHFFSVQNLKCSSTSPTPYKIKSVQKLMKVFGPWGHHQLQRYHVGLLLVVFSP